MSDQIGFANDAVPILLIIGSATAVAVVAQSYWIHRASAAVPPTGLWLVAAPATTVALLVATVLVTFAGTLVHPFEGVASPHLELARLWLYLSWPLLSILGVVEALLMLPPVAARPRVAMATAGVATVAGGWILAIWIFRIPLPDPVFRAIVSVSIPVSLGLFCSAFGVSLSTTAWLIGCRRRCDRLK